MLRPTFGLLSLISLALALTGCGGGGIGGPATPKTQTVAYQWNDAGLRAIEDLKPSPPVASRSLGILNTAIYDAWAAYDSKALGTELGGTLRRPATEQTQANKEQAIAYAAYRVLVDLYPADQSRFDAQMAAQGFDPGNTALDPTTPAGIGNMVAKAILDDRHNDGSNQLGGYKDTTGYIPKNTVDDLSDPAHWQPQRFVAADGTVTIPGFTTPHWGKVKTFSIDNVTALRPGPPAMYPSDEFKAQVQEIVDLTANLTDEQKCIAEYWKDGPKSVTPPGHWTEFAQYVSRRDRHTLDEDVKMFFMVGNAVMDAAICCWDTKVFYDTVRPISAIRYLYKDKTIMGWGGPGKGTIPMSAGDWRPYQPLSFITPPFAEYTSGHSTFSAAAAEVLKLYTGSDNFGNGVVIGRGELSTEPGVTPHYTVRIDWPTFSAAADQAGMSRRWGGIHLKDGDLTGRAMGRQVGDRVYTKAMSLINGTAATP